MILTVLPACSVEDGLAEASIFVILKSYLKRYPVVFLNMEILYIIIIIIYNIIIVIKYNYCIIVINAI